MKPEDKNAAPFIADYKEYHTGGRGAGAGGRGLEDLGVPAGGRGWRAGLLGWQAAAPAPAAFSAPP